MKELDKDLKVLLDELRGKDFINSEQCSRMFNLNNAIFPDLKEWTQSCGACRERVYNRLVQYSQSKSL
jgi:hypothetical protein